MRMRMPVRLRSALFYLKRQFPTRYASKTFALLSDQVTFVIPKGSLPSPLADPKVSSLKEKVEVNANGNVYSPYRQYAVKAWCEADSKEPYRVQICRGNVCIGK